jgi:hypothetical protein
MFYISKTKRLVQKKILYLTYIHHQLTNCLQAFQRHLYIINMYIQGVIESCTDILTTSYWLHVELGKNI